MHSLFVTTAFGILKPAKKHPFHYIEDRLSLNKNGKDVSWRLLSVLGAVFAGRGRDERKHEYHAEDHALKPARDVQARQKVAQQRERDGRYGRADVAPAVVAEGRSADEHDEYALYYHVVAHAEV